MINRIFILKRRLFEGFLLLLVLSKSDSLQFPLTSCLLIQAFWNMNEPPGTILQTFFFLKLFSILFKIRRKVLLQIYSCKYVERFLSSRQSFSFFQHSDMISLIQNMKQSDIETSKSVLTPIYLPSDSTKAKATNGRTQICV